MDLENMLWMLTIKSRTVPYQFESGLALSKVHWIQSAGSWLRSAQKLGAWQQCNSTTLTVLQTRGHCRHQTVIALNNHCCRLKASGPSGMTRTMEENTSRFWMKLI